MELAQAKKFMDALTTAGITNYSFLDDIQTRYYNDDRAVIVLDETNNMLWNFRKALPMESREGIAAIGNNIEDIRRAQVIGDYKTIKAFVDAYGLTLTDDQLNVLLILNSTNKEIMPITGDYQTTDDQKNALPNGIAARLATDKMGYN